MCPQHEAEEFQSTGCMFHTDGLNQNVSNIIPMYIYIYIHLLQHPSIHPFHLQSITLQLHKLQTSSIHLLSPCNRATPVHHFWQSCWKTHDCVDAPSGLALSLRLASHGWCGQRFAALLVMNSHAIYWLRAVSMNWIDMIRLCTYMCKYKNDITI